MNPCLFCVVVIGAIFYIYSLAMLISLVYRAWFRAEKFLEESRSFWARHGMSFKFSFLPDSVKRIILRLEATLRLLVWIAMGVIAIILVLRFV